MKKSLLFILFFVFCFVLHAQYYQYSQYNYASQRVNPGAISLSDYATAGFIYRRQDTSPDLKLKSFMFSAKYPIITKNGGDRWSSVGVSMGEDQTGLGGILVYNELGLSYALNVAVGKNKTLSFGTKVNYQSRKVNTDALFTGSQFVSGSGFNLDIGSGEDLEQFNTNFMSYSGGIVWQEEDRNKKRIKHFGLSLFDINRPNESLFNGESPLPSTLVLEGGYSVFENQLISIYPEFLYTYSTATSALNIGAVTRYSLDYINPRSAGSALEIHTKYLLNEGVMLGLQFVNDGFSTGISYDIPLHKTVAHRGAFEIGFELRKLVESRYKATKRRVKKIRRKRIKKVRKSNRRKKNSNKKNEVKELLTNNSDGKTKNSSQEETVVIANNDTEESKGKEFLSDNDEHKTDDVNAHTTIGLIKHESLLLEPTQLVYYFDFNSADTEQEAKDYISDLVSILHEDEYIKIKIVGHTDNVGKDDYNQILSRKRAQVIVDLLTQNNISNTRITSEGRGESEPLLKNNSAENRSKNRRVEITLYY